MRKISRYTIIICIVILFIILSYISPGIPASEPPTVEWSKTFGGKKYDAATDHIQTIDGGYAIVGSTSSLGPRGQNFWLVKTSNNGTIEWNKAYGGKGDDFAYAIIQTDDFGFAIAGATTSFDTRGDFDFLLIKTNSTGDVEWYKTYGDLFDDHATALIKTTDGGYAIVGVSNTSVNDNDFLLIKIGSKGIIEWSETYGGAGEEKAWSLIQTQDNGFAISGSTTSYGSGSSDSWLVKTDQNGTMQWNRTFGGKDEDSAQEVIQTTDGGFALGGETKSFGTGNYDFWLVKTDQNGTMQWNRTFGGKDEDSARAIIQTTDDGYLLGGFSEQMFYYDFFLVKTSPHGYMQWSKNFSFGTDEKAYSLIQTTDGNYSMAGPSQSRQGYNFFMVKTNNSNVTVDNLFPVADAGDDKSAFVGESVSFNGSAFDPDGNITYYRWDFDGDGIYDFESNKSGLAEFIYEEEGTYQAFFEITDNNGSISYDMKELTITKNKAGINEISERNWFCIIIISLLVLSMLIIWYSPKNKKINKYLIKKIPFLKLDIWWYRLIILFILITLIKFVYTCFINSPWIYFDEPTYGILAERISQGELMLLGETTLTHPYPVGYSYLIAPSYWLGNNMEVIYQGILFINCCLTSLVVFPVFLIMKRFVDKKISLFSAVIIATLPMFLVHNYLLMSENAFYLFFIISCFLLIKTSEFKTIDKTFIFYLVVLGFCVRYLIFIKAIGIAMVAALFFIFLYKLIKHRNLYGLSYTVPLLPSIPILYQIFIPAFQKVFLNGKDASSSITPPSTIPIIGYETSQYLQRQINAASDSTLFTRFISIIIHEINYFILMSYIVFFLFTVILFIYWKKISKEKKEHLLTFSIYGISSAILLIIITSNHIYRSQFSIYSRYVSVALPIFFMLGIIGYYLFQNLKSKYKWHVVAILAMLLCTSVLLLFPTENYKLVNNFDLIWVTSLKSFSFNGIDGYILSSIVLASIIILILYLLIFSLFFNKKIIKKLPRLPSKYITILVLAVSVLLFIPSASLSFTNEHEIYQRGINKPAQWLMKNDPEATVIIEDQYAAFSGGGMISEYWAFMYADMQFWFPKGQTIFLSKEGLNQIIQTEQIKDIDYIVSTHDLTSKYQSVADFYMDLEPAKRQGNVDWYIYKIN